MPHFTLLNIPLVRRTLLLLVGLLAGWTAPIAALAQAPTNDDPCGAVVLSPQGPLCTTSTLSTNLGATTTVPNGYGNTGNPLDVWFKFTTAASGASSFGATITVNGNPASFVQLFSAPSCAGPFAPIAFSASNQANTTAPRLITGSLQASTTYYVRVSGNASFNDVPGPFTICVSDGPGVPSCGSPVVGQFTATSATSGTISFTPGLNNSPSGPFLVTVQNTTTQTQVGTPFTVTASPITLNGLVAGNSYSVTVATSCPAGGQASGSNSFNLAVSNDDPCGAIALPVGSTCAYTTSNNANATASTGNFGSNTGTCSNRGSHDVWFTFTTAAAGQTGSTGVTVSTNGQASAAGTLRVYAAATCSGPFTPLGCSTSTFASGPGAAGPLVVSNLVPNTTYYVRVDEGGFFNTGIPGSFSICVVGAVGCAAPTQFYSGIVGATTAPLFWTAGNGNQSYTITYTAQGGTPQTVTAPAGSTYTLTNLTPGTRYTVSLVGNCAGGNASTAVTTTFTTAIVNDEPCGAVAVPLSGASCTAPTSVSFFGATTTAPSPLGYANPGCDNSTSPNDVWFTFTTATSGPAATGATLSAAGTDIYEVRVFSGPGCTGPFVQVGCAAAPSNGSVPPLTLTGLTPGTTYYVKLTGYTNGSNPTSLCIVNPAPCPGPTGLTAGTLTSTSATLSFTPGAGSTGYVVTYQAAGGAMQTVSPAPVGSPVVLNGLTPSTSYTATVQAVCPAGLGAPLIVTFTTPATPPSAPANDECATATSLTTIGTNTCGTLLTGTVTGATSSAGAPAPGCASYQGGDVWYSLVVPANGVLQVETGAAGSSLSDTGLALYSGNCGSLTLLGCNDDIGGGNNFSRLRQTGLAPGSTVYARVWRYANATLGGDFTICAQTDAACPAVTGLVAGSITGSAATLTFSGPANATGYTVTYQAANGAVQTQTATASPVVLSGLSNSTTYTATVTTTCGPGQTSTAATVTFITTAPCPAVTNVAVSNLTGTSATLTFTAPAAASGGFTITLTPTSGGPSQTLTATTSPVQLTGLTALTGYTVSIVGNCGGGLNSAPATASFFSTAYCTSALGGSCGGQNLTNVSIATTPLNNTSTCATTGTGGSTAAYSSYPAAGSTTADLVRGRTYSINLTSDGSTDLSLWIDFNRNGQFEASEHTQVVLNGIANLPATATFAVPATAQLGLTGLRVRSRSSGAGNGPGDACTGFGSGETEDYLVTLVDAVVNSTQNALAAQISLYPNPARHLATLHLPAALARQATTVVLYNALGQSVRRVALPATTDASGSSTPLDLVGLPSGVYALRINTAAGLLTKRLVVE